MADAVRQPSHPRPLSAWILSPWLYVPLSIAVGIFVVQAVTGQLAPRWIKAAVGIIFILSLLRIPLYAVVCLFLIAFPFPTIIFVGNTNILFVIFMLAVWGVKVRLGKEPAPPKSYLDYAAWCYVAVHFISLINVDEPDHLRKGAYQATFLAAAAGLYFLVSKLLRTERQLRIALNSLVVTSFLVSITGVTEYFSPNTILVPDWFIDPGPTGKRLAEGGRVGGVFGFHGLLADFCAMMFILQAYLFIRSKSLVARAFYLVLMAAGVFQIFVTANRGGFIIWIVGLAYLLWFGSRGLTPRRLVVALPLIILVGFTFNTLFARTENYFALFIRLAATQIERGVPDTRVGVWSAVLQEVPEHPVFGHGPYYPIGIGGLEVRRWPHSAYLFYLWSTGIVGLAIFLWILLKSIARSYPGGRFRLGEIGFARGALVVIHIQIVQFALSQIRDEHQRGNVNPFLMWAMIGLAVAARRIDQEGENAKT